MKPVRTALAAALALAALPAFAQQSPYTQTIFFGDSLTDAGTFRPVLVQIAGPTAASGGRFTTNPALVWAEYLADFYGTNAGAANQGGTNYATGGARVGTNGTQTFGPISVPVPSLQTQVTSYLSANGGRADSRALYTVWGGANDLFAIGAGAPLSTLTTAVTTQIGLVSTLTSAGARYILVPTLPDMGLTPAARAQGAAAQAQFTTLSSTYNTALFNGLASAGLRVIPLDTYNLLREVVASPSTFGITNVTGTACNPQVTAQSLTCSPANYANPSAPYTYLFADGVHPSLVTHQILGDYAISVLEAPRQISLMQHSAATTGRARADRIDAQAAARGASEGEGMRWWADVRGDFQRYGKGDIYDGAIPALTAGVDWRSGGLVYGVFGGVARGELDWGLRGGSFEQSEGTLGGYVGWRSGGAWVNGQLSWTQLDLETERNVRLGPATRVHRGSTDGTNVTAGVEGGFEFGSGALRHGPIVGVLAQRIDIDAFAEDQATLSTSLAYPEQNVDSLIGKLGWQLRVESDHVAPYARLTVDREFEDEEREAFARSQSIAGSPTYAVPGVEFDDTYATLRFGVRTDLLGLKADVGASLTSAQKGGNDATVFLTVGSDF
jgi:outer membrane lipase/esterase